MSLLIKITTIFLFFISNATASNYYQKIIHNTDPEAKCLDGTPGALYLH
jgi:hypothetical protein